MRIWVDADACPRFIRELILGIAARHGARVTFVANRPMGLPEGAEAFADSVEVDAGPDVADNYIVRHAEPGSVVITADIPLAHSLVARRVHTLSPRGLLFNEANIEDIVAVRDFMHSLRDSGIQTGGPRPFEERDKAHFFDQLRALLQP